MNILILTGAGISAESGIPTFRGPNGLWRGHRPEEMASPEAFASNPDLVHAFYNERRRKLLEADIQPNAAHHALAEFERQFDGQFLLVTQNVDDLHYRAGTRNIVSMHGELLKARCLDTAEVFQWTADLDRRTPHPRDPSRLGRLRPHIVWFGEVPFGLDRIEQAASQADVFVAIGTSAVVYPAAGIVSLTPPDCYRIEVNMQDTPQSTAFDEALRGPASQLVPQILARIRSGQLRAG